MELERAIKRLEAKNDFEQLSVEGLKEKYAKDADTAKNFLELYKGITVEGSDNHSKIRELLTFIKEERFKDTEVEKDVDWLIEYLNMEEGLTVVNIYRKGRDHQAYDLKLENLGITDTYGYMKYPELISMLYESTKKIDECHKANPNFPNYEDYRFMLFSAIDKSEGDPIRELDYIKDYYNRFPLLNLCHDENFVIAFNSLLKDDNFDDKNELISLYYNVVDFSLTFPPVDKDFDEKSYSKAVGVANRKLKEYQKTHKDSKVYRR